MPFAGLGLHVILALICAVHAIRTRQNMYWLFILFGFPLLGSLAYAFAIYLPNSSLERGAMKAVSKAARALDPLREVRDARAAFEDTPTAQNQMRLASALLETGDSQAAAQQYMACLNGPYAQDVEIRFGAAKAFVECQRFQDALTFLNALRQERPDFRPEAVSLLLARALGGAGHATEERREFENAIERFGTFEAKAEYAIWAYATGDSPTSERLHKDLLKIRSRWNALTLELNEPVVRRLDAARALATRQDERAR
ncbi:MAG: tetratricopeptide repeat protein [Hydrogenophaga sp.]|uniref:tetratricopeptide repeat protein n=1 Tax=Hydrogenophaga sp. TaxID=1904254 RepID=UPI002ABB092F|nr:tetratricopeptide repeat protein [Hydrogenophaga sp.]MDZ4100214.1 tetratricopeptide repeat protein [Hydrogenophaga sp.]